MITWTVPLSRYPDTYNGKPLCYAALAAQKNNTTLYLMTAYGSRSLRAGLQAAFKKAGKRFNMGGSCLHFQTLDDLVPEAVGKVVAAATPAQFIKHHEAIRRGRKGR
jgi:hypothetical protein